MDDDDYATGPIGPKTREFNDVQAILAKLEGKAAMWERVARDNKDRAQDFERAAQAVRDGASAVTVGRTTYVLVSRDEKADDAVG
ncbi:MULTISPECIES: hypothetical protein [Streptomyces]|uniref:hypothetical protein n=1 Tax=Streptomyces TaxID=1883 RepID=UPI0016004071|nr:hypothetical protein [Streptomyces murinus]MBA9050821.1 hypothetical protein [Streptomyces murinus]